MNNIHFTKSKKLIFDKNYNLLYDGEITEKNVKEIYDSFPPCKTIVIHMGSISGDIISIMKSITDEVGITNRQVYIYDGSTPEDFWYCTV